MNATLCPHCGQPHEPGSAFCPATGQPLPVGFGAPPHAGTNVRHAYPLAIQEASLTTAFGLLMRTLPYALVRFGVLVAVSFITIVWWVITVGGFGFLANRVAPWVGFAWLMTGVGMYGFFWQTFVRYFLYLLKAGHIVILTDLITKGHIDDGGLGMFAYGKEVVTKRFGQVNALFALDLLVRGVVGVFNRTLDWIANLLPIPGLNTIVGVVNAVVRASTRYLDETIFSYGLARGDNNPWRSAQDGLIYYAQNSKDILKTGVYVVILDKVLSVVAWIVMLVPAVVLSMMLPASIKNGGSFFIVVMGALFAANIRSAFLKPLFLIMVMTKFHVSVRGQDINLEWDARLTQLSEKFRQIKQKALNPAVVGAGG